jgi:hypothetical protein
MGKKLNFGFKTLFSVAVIVALSGAFMLSSCSKDKEEEVEETVKTEEVIEAATPAPAPQAEQAPSEGAYSGSQGTAEAQPTTGPRIRLENQVPPELAGPCMAKNAGDACTVTITGDRQIDGECKMTKTEELACMPKARPGKGARTQ